MLISIQSSFGVLWTFIYSFLAFHPLAGLHSHFCYNKARSPSANLCNIWSTFCFGQMPGQYNPSSTHLFSTCTQLPKSVFNCLENGRLHPCNKGIRVIRKINEPGNDVNQTYHDWNSIRYAHGHVHAPVQSRTLKPPRTQKRLTQNTISEISFQTQTKISSPGHHSQKLYISIIAHPSQLNPEREELSLLLFSSRPESQPGLVWSSSHKEKLPTVQHVKLKFYAKSYVTRLFDSATQPVV